MAMEPFENENDTNNNLNTINTESRCTITKRDKRNDQNCEVVINDVF